MIPNRAKGKGHTREIVQVELNRPAPSVLQVAPRAEVNQKGWWYVWFQHVKRHAQGDQNHKYMNLRFWATPFNDRASTKENHEIPLDRWHQKLRLPYSILGSGSELQKPRIKEPGVATTEATAQIIWGPRRGIGILESCGAPVDKLPQK